MVSAAVALLVPVLFGSVLSAQLGTELVAEQDLGRPRRPPLITLLGVVVPAKMATDPSVLPKGAVAEVLFEELRAERLPAGPANEVVLSVKIKYDDQGRVIEEIRKEYGGETTTRSIYQGNRLVGQETAISVGRSQPKSWSYWTYDQSGKLIEYRRGSEEKIQNHETNFKRDLQGRLTSFEYRQGEKDELFSRTELHYSPDGKTVDISTSYHTGGGTSSTTQTFDDQGNVAKVVI